MSALSVTLSLPTAEAFAMTFTDFANATETDVPCNVAISIGKLTTNTAVVHVGRDSFHFNARRNVHRGRHKKKRTSMKYILKTNTIKMSSITPSLCVIVAVVIIVGHKIYYFNNI